MHLCLRCFFRSSVQLLACCWEKQSYWNRWNLLSRNRPDTNNATNDTIGFNKSKLQDDRRLCLSALGIEIKILHENPGKTNKFRLNLRNHENSWRASLNIRKILTCSFYHTTVQDIINYIHNTQLLYRVTVFRSDCGRVWNGHSKLSKRRLP